MIRKCVRCSTELKKHQKTCQHLKNQESSYPQYNWTHFVCPKCGYTVIGTNGPKKDWQSIMYHAKLAECRGCGCTLHIFTHGGKWWKQDYTHNYPSRARRREISKQYYCWKCRIERDGFDIEGGIDFGEEDCDEWWDSKNAFTVMEEHQTLKKQE